MKPKGAPKMHDLKMTDELVRRENGTPENAWPEIAGPKRARHVGTLSVLLKMPDAKLFEFFRAVAQGPGSLHFTAHRSNSGGTSPKVGWKWREFVQKWHLLYKISDISETVDVYCSQTVSHLSNCWALVVTMLLCWILCSVLLLKYLWLTFCYIPCVV